MKKYLLRWELITLLIPVLAAVTIYYVYLPLGSMLTHEIRLFIAHRKATGDAHGIPVRIRNLEKSAARLDSIIAELSDPQEIDQPSLVAVLYATADSLKMRTAKVETGIRTDAGQYVQAPVIVQATGSYGSVGRFVEGIENLSTPARIRQISLKAAGRDEVEMYMDFVLVNQRTEDR